MRPLQKSIYQMLTFGQKFGHPESYFNRVLIKFPPFAKGGFGREPFGSEPFGSELRAELLRAELLSRTEGGI